MNQADFEGLLNDTTKRLLGTLRGRVTKTFADGGVSCRGAVRCRLSDFVKGSYNALAGALSYTLSIADVEFTRWTSARTIHNPSCTNIGEKHKHRWREPVRDKEAYAPDDITAPPTDPVAVWQAVLWGGQDSTRGNHASTTAGSDGAAMSLSTSEVLGRSWARLFSYSQVNGFTRIRTPFLYPDGDVIDLFLQEKKRIDDRH